MADSISETDVINEALALIGEEPLSSLSDDSKAKRHAQPLFYRSRNECFDLRVNWRFCEARAEVAAHADAPIHGSYDYQFVLPANCRRIRKVQESTDDDTQYKFRREVLVTTSGSRQVETAVILCEVSTAYITYTRLIKNPKMWPEYFVRLVAVREAIKLCSPLKQDKRKKEQLRSMYQDALADAKAGNGAEDQDVTDDNTNLDEGNTDVVNAATDEEIERRYIQVREQ